MKILLTANDITIFGGIERVLVNLSNVLIEKGYEVKILSFYRENDTTPYPLDSGVKIEFFPNIKNIHTKNILKRVFNKIFYRFFVAHKMKKLYAEYDIIIYNCYFFPFFKNKHTRYIKIIHGYMKNFKPTNIFRYKFFDCIVLLSSKQQLLEWQKHHKNVKIIPNFLPSMPEKMANLSQKVVLSVGRLYKEKGFLRLIESWDLICKQEKYKDWKLHIVGGGELEQEIKIKIKEKNLQEFIELKPFTKEIEKEYLSASIYAMTSFFEGFGMVLIEASSYALPCIAFDVPVGPSAIIENEKTGFLIEDNNLKEFASKLCFLMDNEDLREQMGKAARLRIQENFSKEVVMKQWEELFGELKTVRLDI